MACDFTRGISYLRLVAENEIAVKHLIYRRSRQIDRAIRIVIAVDPYPVTTTGHLADQFAQHKRQMLGPDPIVEIVAEADDDLRIVTADKGRQDFEGSDRVVRRQHAPAPGKGRTFSRCRSETTSSDRSGR